MPITESPLFIGGNAQSHRQNAPELRFNDEGSYSVELTVTTAYGTDTVSHEISVSAGQGEIVNQDVRVVDDVATLSLDEESGDDYTFTYTGNGVPPVEPGDIVVGTEGEGYLRRVSAVKSWHTKANGTKSVAIATEFCSLNEAVEKGTLVLDEPIQFTADDLAKAGMVVTKDGAFVSLNGFTLSNSFDADLYGQIGFLPSFDVGIDLDGGELEYLKMAAGGTLDLDLGVVVSAGAGLSYSKEKSVFPALPPTHTTGAMVGPVPVVIVTQFDIVAGLALETAGSVSVDQGFQSTTTVSFGAEFDSGTWNPITGLDISATPYGPVWTIDVEAGVLLYLKPEVRTRLYGVMGPSMAAVPYLGFYVEPLPAPLSAELRAGMDAELAFDVINLDIIHVDFGLGYSHTFEGPSYTLYEWTAEVGPPDLSVDTTSISLNQASPSATVTVSNVGEGTLSWTGMADDPAIEISPAYFIGNSKVVTISTSDFSESYTAQVTFTNDDDAADTEVLTVTVTGSGSGDVTPGEMVSIPAGSFEMGDAFDEGDSDELPVHTVTLSAYEIGKYEVTNQEYADVLNWAHARGYLDEASSTTADAYGVQLLDVDDGDCQISYSGSEFVVESRDGYSMADHPVVEVSWYGAAVYCNWLSESQGLQPCYDTSTWECDFSKNGYHLPTEAQWERAAAWDSAQNRHYRYGNGSDSISFDTVNYNEGLYANPLGLSSYPYTSPVGYYTAVTSPVGCFDMSGNVWEWCSDWYDSGYYSESPNLDPHNASTVVGRVLRGGCWHYHNGYCRSACRDCYIPSYTGNHLGFRLAR